MGYTVFSLDKSFVNTFSTRKAPFGFNGLGEMVYLRTYSRIKSDGTQESWFETVERVVNGTYRMQQRHIEANSLGWDADVAQESAQEMYTRMWEMKFLPPGRGLWAMGSALTEERELFAALNNCAFVSTDNLKKDLHEPFTFLMDASMLGVGVGFDTKGAGQVYLHLPKGTEELFVVPDTREGWVDALKRLLLSFFKANQNTVQFDYSLVRPAGQLIKGFGGIASGPDPLRDMLEKIRSILSVSAFHSKMISVTDIVDIMNLIGKCVVAGNVRRTAEIAFGEADDREFIDLKNKNVNPERNDWNTGWAWTSNNSIFAKIGMNYDDVANRVALNGEPGFAWLDNMQDYGRMCEAPNYKDKKAKGGNPCLEQTLESFELCCLVETFPARNTDLQDFLRTLKFAYLYAKTVTLGKTHWPKTNKVLLKNRRIGLSQSGIQMAVADLGLEQYRTWCEVGYETVQHYDKVYSDWLVIPRSIKTTSVKPSGSVSLLAGATPGMHWPESKTYIRRMTLSAISDLIPAFITAGYHIEPKQGDTSSVIVSIPVEIEDNIRTVSEVSIWEQFAMAAFMQRYWADNQVSCTVTFNPVTEAMQIAPALNYYQYQLKGISLLPKLDYGAYPQMPYEAIDRTTYEEMLSKIKPIIFGTTTEEATSERFCDGDACIIL
jgi:adenosylcobalamin-dependent ribonucleoside-triphosphate reductase